MLELNIFYVFTTESNVFAASTGCACCLIQALGSINSLHQSLHSNSSLIIHQLLTGIAPPGDNLTLQQVIVVIRHGDRSPMSQNVYKKFKITPNYCNIDPGKFC